MVRWRQRRGCDMRKKSAITLGSGFSDKAPRQKANRAKAGSSAAHKIEAAAQVLRDAMTPSAQHPPLSIVSVEPGKARISLNETVSVATALSILSLLQKDRASAE